LESSPAGLRASAFLRIARCAYKAAGPEYYAQHSLSGGWLRVERATADALAAERLPPLEEFTPELHALHLLHLLVDDAVEQEADLFLEHFAQLQRGLLLDVMPDGAVVAVFARPALAPGQAPRGAELALDPVLGQLLLCCDGNTTLGALIELTAQRLGMDPEQVKLRLAETTAEPGSERLLRLTGHPTEELEGLLPCETGEDLSWDDFSHSAETLRLKGAQGSLADHDHYHRHCIQDPQRQFDLVETTVSHAMRLPTSALDGRSYGSSFFDALHRRGAIFGDARVLEVGGGTGVFARAFLERAHQALGPEAAELRYTILDLSPALQEGQRRACAPWASQLSFLNDDVETADLGQQRFDVLIANEMIADLRTLRVEGEPPAIAHELGIDLHDAPERYYLNVGALRMLQRLPSLVKRGGLAVITEFGNMASYPGPTEHLDHDEYSIHWGHMLQAARHLPFSRIELLDLQTLVQLNPNEPMFCGDIFALLRLAARHGVELEVAAYSRADLQRRLPSSFWEQVRGLTFQPLHHDQHYGPGVGTFKALLLRC